MTTCNYLTLACFLLLAAAGCGGGAAASLDPAQAKIKQTVLLTQSPAAAKPVAAARESIKDGDEVAVIGRIGGEADPWVAGRAAFTIVDPKLNPCPDAEGCPTPWDYCCSPAEEIAAHRAVVRVVDAAGAPIEHGAKDFLGLKELQTVVAQGKADVDEAGNLTVLATGIYVMPAK